MRRLIGGLVAAVMLCGSIAVAVPSWSPICAMYTPDDVEWYLFFCYLGDPPPKDPRT